MNDTYNPLKLREDLVRGSIHDMYLNFFGVLSYSLDDRVLENLLYDIDTLKNERRKFEK